MLAIKDIAKVYDDKTILDHLSLSLGSEVTALLGQNGAGKTTLFEIIMGIVEADSGSIETGKETVGYLPQKPEFHRMTVSDYLLQSVDPTETYRIYTVLYQVGLNGINLDIPADSLSGGQKTKLCLAFLLLETPQPTILLLDEPTNNLDQNGILWLEEFIAGFAGSILFTSHDRAFIDDVADRIVFLENGKLTEYGGNYTFFKEQRMHEQEVQKRMFEVQEKKVARIEEDIQRIRSQTLQGEKKFSSGDPYQRRKIRKAAQQGVARKKKLEKFLLSEKRIEKPIDRKNYPFAFTGDVHRQKFILGIENVSKQFGEKAVLKNVSFSISGQERIWLSGKNGSGKSTILKLAAGLLDPDTGKVTTGNEVKIGYFSQEGLHQTTDTGLDLMLAKGATQTQAFEYAQFLHFQLEDLKKPLTALSRGQITKLAIIALLMEQNHLLILDEPTNHLEIDTREEIENALSLYEGAILLASHDRYFVETIGITKVYIVEDGTIIQKQV